LTASRDRLRAPPPPAVRPLLDLQVLTADAQWKAVLDEILRPAPRLGHLGVRRFTSSVVYQPGRTDGWMRSEGPGFSRALRPTAARCLLVFDYQGCGATQTPEAIEHEVEMRLRKVWGPAAAVLVVAPELEEWLVGAQAAFKHLDGLGTTNPGQFWRSRGLWPEGDPKPPDPKAAVGLLLHSAGHGRAAAVYRELAKNASLRTDRCRSRTFHKLIATLRDWFPAPAGATDRA
jgi:hypothetical protein